MRVVGVGALAALGLALGLSGCGTRSQEAEPARESEPAREPAPAREAERARESERVEAEQAEGATAEELAQGSLRFAREAVTVGEVTDGVTVAHIRHATHPDRVTIVFETRGPAVPHTTARLEGSRLRLELSGVRGDESGLRPLTREDGTPFGTPVDVGSPPVRSYARLQVLDDAEIHYAIDLDAPAGFAVRTLPNPDRIIVHIAR